MDIEKELQKFNITNAAISELSQKYMPLIIKGIDDKEGLKVVNAARKVVKGYRIDVDKLRKELNADALNFQRSINAEAKRITSLLEPIESHLESEENKINDEIERIKREKEQEQIARYQTRVAKLIGLNFMFDSVNYFTTYIDTFNNDIMKVSVLFLKQMTDEAFNDFYDNAKHYFDIEEKVRLEKKALEEEERKALIQLRREQEMERERLADIAHMQASKEAELKAEAERIENEKSFVCTKQDVNPVNELLPDPESEEVKVDEIIDQVLRQVLICDKTISDFAIKHNVSLTQEQIIETLIIIDASIDENIEDLIHECLDRAVEIATL